MHIGGWQGRHINKDVCWSACACACACLHLFACVYGEGLSDEERT